MNILFICTGNTCRSPMAEGILKDFFKDRKSNIRVSSAGIFAQDGGPIAKNAIEVLKDIDIDISYMTSKSINREMLEESDLILTMSQGHKSNLLSYHRGMEKKIFLLNEYAWGISKDVEDPYGGSKMHYEKARDEIYEAILKIVEDMGKK